MTCVFRGIVSRIHEISDPEKLLCPVSGPNTRGSGYKKYTENERNGRTVADVIASVKTERQEINGGEWS